MNIKAIIVDDESNARLNLSKKIGKSCPSVEIVAEASTTDEAYKLIELHRPDLVFLDVELPPKTSFDLLLDIQRKREIDFVVIFVTTFEKYAVRAFRFAAIDFITKPIDIDSLIDAVKRVENRMTEKVERKNEQILLNNLKLNPKDRTIGIKIDNKDAFVPIGKIIYFEYSDNIIKVHLEDGSWISSTSSLKYFQDILCDDFGFVKVDRQHIVNLKYVALHSYRHSKLTLKNKRVLAVSKRQNKVLRDALAYFSNH